MSLRAKFQLQFPAFSINTDLTLPSRGFIGVFGRSGSGKTTLLRCVAGLERAQGECALDGEVWQNEQTFLSTHKRAIGYVFQEASLFPHLSARGNLDYALKRAAQSQGAIDFKHAVDLLNIAHLLDQNATQLSGGERQRVAIARALLIKPRLLLMDEPLASLDLEHKKEILPYLERIHRELDIPVLYVSHAADEIARLADHLVVMERGRVVANGPLTETLSRLDLPIHFGEDTGVMLEARISQRDQQWKLALANIGDGNLWLRDQGLEIGATVRLRILARDVSIALHQPPDSSILNLLPVIIEDLATDLDAGSALLRLKAGRNTFLARITLKSVHELDLRPGREVWAQVKSVALIT